MLNSAEHEIYPAHKCKMPTIVGILTFLSRIIQHMRVLKQEKSYDFVFFNFYVQLKFHAVELNLKSFITPRLIVTFSGHTIVLFLCSKFPYSVSIMFELSIVTTIFSFVKLLF